MILSEQIYKKARQLVARCGSRNPFEIADMLGVHLYYEQFSSLLGLYTCKWRRRMIFLNNRLEEPFLSIVLAHELGHDCFHRDLAKNGLREYNIFGIKEHTEQEANAFAAQLLLDEDDVADIINEGNTLSDTARILCTSEDLLLIKLEQMNILGWHVDLPHPSNRDFIKKL